MRRRWNSLAGVRLLAPALVITSFGLHPSAGDEPGRLGRFFRFGSGNSSNSSAPAPGAPESRPATPAVPAPATAAPAIDEPSSPVPLAPSSAPRIVPRSRVTRPVTESDPIVTRITLNRSDDGNQFGMFLQVYADGTVIDSEGVHHVGQDALKPIVEVLQSGELSRPKTYCGAPATDFVESAQVVVYERSLGRLRANAFSYSGNPQGCDNAIRHLHVALDGLQAKIVRTLSGGPQANGGGTAPTIPPGATVPGTGLPAATGSQTVIPLTAPN
jgi:hypothetical protein